MRLLEITMVAVLLSTSQIAAAQGSGSLPSSASFKTLNGVRNADSFGDFATALSDCAADAYCGEVTSSAGLSINRPFRIGTGLTGHYNVKLGARSKYVVNVTGGLDAITIANGSMLEGSTLSTYAIGYGNGIELGPRAHVRALIAPASRDGKQDSFSVRNITLGGNATATVASTGALLDVQGVFLGSTIENVNIWGPYHAAGFRLRPGLGLLGGLKITSDVPIWNLQSNGGNVAGARPCVIENNGERSSSGVAGISFFAGGCQHAGSGNDAMLFDGHDTLTGVLNIGLYNHHIEGSPSTGVGLRLKDVRVFGTYGLPLSGAYAAGVKIEESRRNNTQSIVLRDVGTSTVGTTISNAITGRNWSDLYIGEYSFRKKEIHESRTVVANDTVKPVDDANVPITLQWNSGSQSGDMLKIIDNKGQLLAHIDKSGQLHVGGNGYYYGGSDATMALNSADVRYTTSSGAALTARVGSIEINSTYGTTPPPNGLYAKGLLKSDSGLVLGSSSTSCDASQRGRFNYVAGAHGVKDTVQVCAKDAADNFAWRTIY